MKNTGVKIIERIEIKRFRSFGNASIDVEEINVFSGKNNAGKSNILKALNLFFNNKTNYDVPYNHKNDYNIAYTDAAGGKRNIEITLHFAQVGGKGALKDKFSVKRIFDNSGNIEQEIHSENTAIEEKLIKKDGNIKRQFTAFLNKLEYIYVPAVRDKEFVKTLLLKYEDIIKSDAVGEKEFNKAIEKLPNVLTEKSEGVSNDFEQYIGLPAHASLSSTTSDVLGAIEVLVKSGIQTKKKDSKEIVNKEISLFSSGDGILMSYIAHFLAYFTSKSSKKFIWGFEEPENSLEYSKVQDLANLFDRRFRKNAQIFITTHSPAFIALGRNGHRSTMYRVFIPPQSEDDKKKDRPNKCETIVKKLNEIENWRQQTLFKEDQKNIVDTLEQELHLVELSADIQNIIEEARRKEEKILNDIENIKNKLSKSKKLSIITEGNNIQHIKQAIKLLDPELLKKINLVENIQDCTGISQLQQYFKYECARNEDAAPILFVFDCDADNRAENLIETARVFKYAIAKNDNGAVLGGIENIYPKDFLTDDLFNEETKINNDGDVMIRRIDKQKALQKALQCVDNSDHIFDGYTGIIEKIKHILSARSV